MIIHQGGEGSIFILGPMGIGPGHLQKVAARVPPSQDHLFALVCIDIRDVLE